MLELTATCKREAEKGVWAMEGCVNELNFISMRGKMSILSHHSISHNTNGSQPSPLFSASRTQTIHPSLECDAWMMRLKRWQQSRAKKNFLKSFFANAPNECVHTNVWISVSVNDQRRRRWCWCCDSSEMGKSHGMAWRWKKREEKKRSEKWTKKFRLKKSLYRFSLKMNYFLELRFDCFFPFPLLHTPPTPLTALTARASILPSFLTHSTATAANHYLPEIREEFH